MNAAFFCFCLTYHIVSRLSDSGAFPLSFQDDPDAVPWTGIYAVDIVVAMFATGSPESLTNLGRSSSAY